MNPFLAKEVLLGNTETTQEDYEKAARTYFDFYPIQRESIFGSEVTLKLKGRTYLKNNKS